jgi:hypothetical protein
MRRYIYDISLGPFPTREEQAAAYESYYHAREMVDVAERALQADPENEDLLKAASGRWEDLEVATANYLGRLHLPPEVRRCVSALCGGRVYAADELFR